MNKKEFLAGLYPLISDLGRRERRERLAFYSEMIDDRMEEGLTEEEAVSAIGSLEEIRAELLAERPVKEKGAGKKRGWTIALFVFASPILLSLGAAWFSVLISLLVGALSVLLSLVAAVWSVVISSFAVFLSLLCAGLGCLVLGGVFVFLGRGLEGVAGAAAGVVLCCLSVLFVIPCRYAAKGGAFLTVLAWRASVGCCRLFARVLVPVRF